MREILAVSDEVVMMVLNFRPVRLFFQTTLEAAPGPVAVVWSDRGLFSVRLGEDLRPRGRPTTEIKVFIENLERYLSGETVNFEVPLDLPHLTAFQRNVLDACWRVPYGTTATYGDLAREVGRPKAARAVGQVMGANPVPIVIPCHRIVGAGGKPGGFGAGLTWKRYLLSLEGVAL